MEATNRAKLSSDQLVAFVRELNAAVRKLGIYPPGHPASVKATEKPFNMLEDLLHGGRLILAVADGRLIGNGVPLDDRSLQDGLGKILNESGLSSVTFEQGIPATTFEKFIAQLNVKKEQRDLQGFIQREGIKTISIGKVQYQLVGDDERVVSADMVGSGGDGTGEIQSSIAETLRKHPSMLFSILSNGKGVGGSLTAGVATGTSTASPLPSLPAEAGTVLVPAAARELASFSDEELLSLLVAALRENVASQQLTNRFEMGQTLFALKEVLAEREALNLLPQLQQSLADLNMVDPKYLELIFAADSSPRKVAHLEVQHFKNDFVTGDIHPEQVGELLGWLQAINTDMYTEDFVKSLYVEVEARRYAVTQGQRLALQQLASLGSALPDAIAALTQLAEIRERLADPSLSLEAFSLLVEELEVYYLKFLEMDRFAEASQLLSLVCEKIDSEIIYAEGIADLASQVHQRLTSTKIAENLLAKLKQSFEAYSKAITQLLENFNGIEPILVFIANITHDHRGIRVLLLRLLSGFGERAIAAFRLLLSDRTLTARPAGQSEVPQESWYKIRNIIFVLSNIKHPDSVALVESFADDRDRRVVLEVVNALERLGGDRAAEVSSRLLFHPQREVQIKAMHNLVANGSPQFSAAVEEYFVRNVEERANSLPALIKLDKQRALGFLAAILLGEAETYNKYYGKPDEELNETIVSTFIQLRSTVLDDILRKYVRAQTRSLLGQLRKPNSVKIAERYLKTTSSGL